MNVNKNTVTIEINGIEAGILVRAVLDASWPGKILDVGVCLRDKLLAAESELRAQEDKG